MPKSEPFYESPYCIIIVVYTFCSVLAAGHCAVFSFYHSLDHTHSIQNTWIYHRGDSENCRWYIAIPIQGD
jgi:hypothetical protein